MQPVNRRVLLKAGALAAAAAPLAFAAPAPARSAGAPSSAAAAGEGVTATLAAYLVRARYDDLPAPVRREGVRTLLNWVGVAVGGSRHETVTRALAALTPFAGPPQASLLGRHERLDIMTTAFLNGVASHIFDFDDTHLKTIIHPAGPVVSAILALAEYRPVNGRDFLNALVLGVETECRIGNAVYPAHYDVGWHITGTAGVFGAAAASGKLLGLSEQQMRWALGLAASQPVGLRESFGSMNKSFNPGRAASNGLFAALLAAQDFTSSEQMLEAKRGWAHVVSTQQDFSQITAGLGNHYEAALNTYKPFACGIVIHPALDAAIQLRERYQLTSEQIKRIDLSVHPLVLELTGKQAPNTGLEGKFSVYHSVAVAFVQGAAGERQYSDAAVRDPAVVALRQRVVATVDPAIKPEQVDMRVQLKDGRTLHQFIEHAVGSLEVPMTDAQLDAKFSGLADGILSPARIQTLIATCRGVEHLADAGEIARAGVEAS